MNVRAFRAIFLSLIAASLVLSAPAGACTKPARFTSVEVGPYDRFGNVTILVGRENAWDLQYRWNNGPNHLVMFYDESPKPNPYPITVNAACLIGSPELKLTLRCGASTDGNDAHDDRRTVSIPAPVPVVSVDITAEARETEGALQSVNVDYTVLNPSDRGKILRVWLAKPFEQLSLIYSKPDAYGVVPSSPVKIPAGPGTVFAEVSACWGSPRAYDSIELFPDCDENCPEPAESVGDPISVARGNTTFTEEDPLPATDFFRLERRFDSRAADYKRHYYFGSRVRSSLEASLRTRDIDCGTTQDPCTAQLVAVDVMHRQYAFRKAGSLYVNLNRMSKVTLRDAGVLRVLTVGVSEHHFAADGRRVAIRDVTSGRAVYFSYQANGDISRVEDSWGNWAWVVTVDPATRLVQSIGVEGTPILVTYQYTGTSTAKRLQNVATTAGTFRTYEAPQNALITAVRDGAGNLLESHTYQDGNNRRGLTSVGPSGEITQIEYNLAGRIGGESLTRVHWKSGRIESRYLRAINGHYRTVEIVDGCASCSGGAVYAYDANGRVTRQQDGIGYVTESIYDASARLLTRRTALTAGGCDPATAAPGACRLTPEGLAGATLQPSNATTSTRYEYQDANWPDQATLVATTSVVDPATERREEITFDPGTGRVLTTAIRGIAAAGVQQTRTTTSAFYDGTQTASFDPGGSFSGAWMTLPQPKFAATSDSPRTDVGDITSVVYYPVDSSVPPVLRGRLAAMRNAAGHITRFEAYDVFGNVLRSVDPNGVVTESTFDSLGRLLTQTVKGVPGCDTNADALCATDLTTTRTYIGAGPLRTETSGGTTTLYEYDTRARLAAVSRGPAEHDLRERIEYTYDPLTGERATEKTLAREGAAWVQKTITMSSYDALGQLKRRTHADNTFVEYTYDAAGRVSRVQDENHATPNVEYAYDGAGRLVTVTQTLAGVSGGVVTRYAYDSHGNLRSVVDPNGNETTYAYNDFGEMIRQVSPVTGTTLYTYDVAGNLLTTTDANGATTTRTYDALNRPLRSESAAPSATSEVVEWSYDGGSFGKGRLTSTTDPTGSASYAYDRRGLLTAETKTILGSPYATTFAYDAAGNRTAVGYPSGARVESLLDHAGRPTATSLRRGTAVIPLVTAAAYLPFGPASSVTYGNGTTKTVQRDQRSLIDWIKLTSAQGTIAHYDYDDDNAGNIVAIRDVLDSSYDRTFSYDDLGRLRNAATGTSLWGNGEYQYDAMGNLTQSVTGNVTRSFGLVGTTPKLRDVTTNGTLRTVAYDAAGNETATGAETFGLSARNHLAAAPGAAYVYDGRGVRTITTEVTGGLQALAAGPVAVASAVEREAPGLEPVAVPARQKSRGRRWFVRAKQIVTGSSRRPGIAAAFAEEPVQPVRLAAATRLISSSTTGARRYSLYTPELQLFAETETTTATNPAVKWEYIWFNGEPLAQIDTTTGAIAYYFNDHLGAPILQTDATGAVVWRVERDPYGERYATRVGAGRHQPLGLPGQEYDASSDRQYNIFRWYRPSWGRYTQSDPILIDPYRQPFGTGSIEIDDATWSALSADDLDEIEPSSQLFSTSPLVLPYAYALNNPLTYIDPTGEHPIAREIIRRTIQRLGPPLKKAWNECRKVKCKPPEFHGPHHRFAAFGGKRMCHLQFNCWRQGVKGSHFVIRIPVPCTQKFKQGPSGGERSGGGGGGAW